MRHLQRHGVTRRRAALAAGAATLLAVAAGASSAPGDLARVSLTDAGAQGTVASSLAAVSADGRYVAFTSVGPLTGAATGGKVQLYVRDRVAGRTILASSSAAGAAANADVEAGDTFNPKFDISGDGRYAVFGSTATNLVAADANGAVQDVFRKDLVTGEVVVVSIGADGAQPAQDGVGDPSASYDGHRVAFATGAAKGLFPGDADNDGDVVLRDLDAGTTTLVSQNSQGQQADFFCERPSIDADGTVVAFEAVTGNSNLFPGQAAGDQNTIVVRDTVAGTTVPAVRTTGGALASGANKPDISGDGRYVVFETGQALDPVNDGNAANDVYRRDLVQNVTALVSAKNASDAAPAAGGKNPAISADGSRVAFTSTATDLTAADTNNALDDVYVRDVGGRATRRASEDPAGAQGANASDSPAVAGNGGLVALTYDDTANKPLITGDTNSAADVFAKELSPTDTTPPALTAGLASSSGTAGRIDVAVTGTAGPDPSGIGSLTVGGRPVTPGANGGFTATARVATLPATITVVATDGSANATTRSVVVPAPVVCAGGAPPGVAGCIAPPTRVRVLRASIAKRVLTVRLRVTTASTVRAQALRVVRVKGKVRLVRTGKPVVKRLAPGVRVLRIILPKRAPAGAYRVRVSVGTAAVTAPAGRLRAR